MPGFFELPDLRAHAIKCGLNMAHAHAVGRDYWSDVVGCFYAHDVLHPEDLSTMALAGEEVKASHFHGFDKAGIDYFTVQS